MSLSANLSFSVLAGSSFISRPCEAAGISWRRCHHEDRGDGIFAITPADVSAETLIDPFATHISASLREYNQVVACAAQIQLRVAVHAGYVYADPHGIAGPAVIHLFRLAEAPALKAELTHRHSHFALIVSDYLYEEIIQYSLGQIGPGLFEPITVDLKETRSRAWIWLPSSDGSAAMLPPSRKPG